MCARSEPWGYKELQINGELIVWEGDRTNFAMLQRRIAGASAVREAYQHPAHFVAFDVLEIAGTATLAEPLARRRELLEALLADAPPQLSLRQRHTTEAVVGGVTGPLARPVTALLGRFDASGRLRLAGRSKPLPGVQQRSLADVLTAAGRRGRGGVNHPWPCPLPAGWSGHFEPSTPLDYQQVAPAVVVEIRVDAAFEHTRWRHAVDLIRVRSDLAVTDVPLLFAE